jgi:hypothetical protein
MQTALNGTTVTVGAPSADSPDPSLHRLNLFFYRFEPGGFDSDVYPDQPWRIRMHCLITALGIDEGAVSAGENDLRLLGEVMRVFRSMPVLTTATLNGEQVRLQTVFSGMSDDQINQIWSTQGDTAYRPSVAYEMSLAPIMPAVLRPEPARVGSIGSTVYPNMSHRHSGFAGTAMGPPTLFVDVDTSNPLWAPAICWLHAGACAQTLSFDVGSAEFAAFAPQVWIAGEPGADIDLVWQTWDAGGWTTLDPPVAATAFSTAIDPDHVPAPVPGTFPATPALPVTLPPDETGAQALLHARRTVTPSPGADPVTVRSNPLLLSLFRVGAP